MDVNAGKIITGHASVDEVGEEIFTQVVNIAEGNKSVSEAMGHREFILTYKYFDAIGPACMPIR